MVRRASFLLGEFGDCLRSIQINSVPLRRIMNEYTFCRYAVLCACMEPRNATHGAANNSRARKKKGVRRDYSHYKRLQEV